MAKQKIVLLKQRAAEDDHYEAYFRQSRSSGELHFVPVIDHVLMNTEHVAEYLGSMLDKIPAIIVTSQRAVESLASALGQIQSTHLKETVLQKPVFSVGPATANMLIKCGFKDVRGKEAGHGVDLAKIILNDNVVLPAKTRLDRHLLFLTGQIHRDIIPSQLAQHGYKYEAKIVYKTTPKPDALDIFRSLVGLLQENNDTATRCWVVFFSSQGTNDIINHLRQDSKVNVASIGPTTKEFLIKKGLPPVVVPEKPSPENLFNSLFEYEKQL